MLQAMGQAQMREKYKQLKGKNESEIVAEAQAVAEKAAQGPQKQDGSLIDSTRGS